MHRSHHHHTCYIVTKNRIIAKNLKWEYSNWMFDDIRYYGLKSIAPGLRPHWSWGLKKHPQWFQGLEKVDNSPDDLQFISTLKARNPHIFWGSPLYPMRLAHPQRQHKRQPTGTGGQAVCNAEFKLLVPSLTANKPTISNWGGLESATPKHTILAYWLFWAKGTKNNRCKKGTLASPFSSWKQEIKNSPVKYALPAPGGKEHFDLPETGSRGWEESA